MKPAIALLACLLAATTADAATVHVPDTVLASEVHGIVALEGAADLHVEVGGQDARYPSATGDYAFLVPDVADGLHRWRITITGPGNASEVHSGIVRVLDMESLIRSEVGRAVESSDNATHAAKDAVTAATNATQAAKDAVAAATVPDDVARRGDLAGLLSSTEFTSWRLLHGNQSQAAHHAGEEATSGVHGRVDGLDRSVSALVFVVLLGLAAVAWYILQVRREAVSLHERAVLRALALRLRITTGCDEMQEALRELDAETRSRPRLRDRVRAFLLGTPAPAPAASSKAEAQAEDGGEDSA